MLARGCVQGRCWAESELVKITDVWKGLVTVQSKKEFYVLQLSIENLFAIAKCESLPPGRHSSCPIRPMRTKEPVSAFMKDIVSNPVA